VAKTILVSNRLPVSVKNERGHLRVERSSGGLATALSGPHAAGSTVWVGWPGDLGRAAVDEMLALEERLAATRCVPVHLTASEVAHYYDGFSNGVLWPLLHSFVGKVDLDADDDWSIYEEVNRRFAERVAELAEPGDVVWVHDYQLALVPEMLRERTTDVKIGFFLHVPFPSPEIFAVLPWRMHLLRGIAGADLVGFHTDAYGESFERTVAALLGARRVPGGLLIDGRKIHVAAHPIGIDVGGFERAAASPEVEVERVRLVAGANGKKIVLGVDRLDYTKGIPRRLLAIERLLDESAELSEQVIFVQVAVPTREKVEAYASLRRQVNELVGRINARHGTATSSPVKLLYRSVSMTELVALYRAADVMLVTPLRDGMNLVAKEYVASRLDERGSLVLSEFAGASAELEGAVVVNPYDVRGVGCAVRRALEMPVAEQRGRMGGLRRIVRANDASLWAKQFLRDLSAAGDPTSGVRTLVRPALAAVQ
jgi:trehalose 6-phosphate synthase/phosphatase